MNTSKTDLQKLKGVIEDLVQVHYEYLASESDMVFMDWLAFTKSRQERRVIAANWMAVHKLPDTAPYADVLKPFRQVLYGWVKSEAEFWSYVGRTVKFDDLETMFIKLAEVFEENNKPQPAPQINIDEAVQPIIETYQNYLDTENGVNLWTWIDNTHDSEEKLVLSLKWEAVFYAVIHSTTPSRYQLQAEALAKAYKNWIEHGEGIEFWRFITLQGTGTLQALFRNLWGKWMELTLEVDEPDTEDTQPPTNLLYEALTTIAELTEQVAKLKADKQTIGFHLEAIRNIGRRAKFSTVMAQLGFNQHIVTALALAKTHPITLTPPQSTEPDRK